MGHRTRLSVSILVACHLSMAGGCAGMSEIDAEHRDYSRADFRNRFIEERSRCHSMGGRIYVNASQTLGRDGIPKRGDRYICA